MKIREALSHGFFDSRRLADKLPAESRPQKAVSRKGQEGGECDIFSLDSGANRRRI
jgi:hypothetical protein